MSIPNEDIRMGGAEGQVGIVTPLPRVREPEVFQGQRSALMVESWLSAMDRYFLLVQINHGQQQLLYATFLLRGDAQLWYSHLNTYGAEQLPQDWEEFKALLRREFVPINAVIQARDQLAVLVQKSSVAEYINTFRRLKLQIPDLSNGDALDRFVRGLKTNIRIAVRSRFPNTLLDAESLALAIEAAAQEEGGISISSQAARQQAQPAINYDPMELDSLRDMVNALAGQVRSQQFNGRGRSNDFSRTRFTGGGYRGNASGNSNGGARCYACGGMGHMKRECPTFLNRSQSRGGFNRGNSHLKD